MPLIRQGRIAIDGFRAVADGEPLPASGPILIGLARWQEDRGLLEPRGEAIGIRLKPADPVEQITADLDRLALVALEFPKFNDGRAFSQARILRQRYGYKGEIRATGRVLRDQLLFMHRSGFDSYELGDDITPEILARAINTFSAAYQPAADEQRSVPSLRNGAPRDAGPPDNSHNPAIQPGICAG